MGYNFCSYFIILALNLQNTDSICSLSPSISGSLFMLLPILGTALTTVLPQTALPLTDYQMLPSGHRLNSSTIIEYIDWNPFLPLCATTTLHFIFREVNVRFNFILIYRKAHLSMPFPLNESPCVLLLSAFSKAPSQFLALGGSMTNMW